MFRRRVARAGLCASWFVVFAAASFACGDDDDSPKGDAGVTGVSGSSGGAANAGKSGGSSGSSGGSATGMIPRPDGGISASDPVPPCKTGNAAPCTKAGQICDWVVRRAAGEMQYTAYRGCVDPGRERGAGDICNLDLTSSPLYKIEGLLDEVHRDICGPGLVCAPDRIVRGLGRCQTACSSGLLDASGQLDPTTVIACAGADEICLDATQVTEYCRKQDGCDAVTQTGCRPNSGEACFLTPSNDWRRIVSVCEIPYDKPTADGAGPCNRFTCNEGSACLGPSSLTPEQWKSADFKCRRVCDSNGTGVTGGAGTGGTGGAGGKAGSAADDSDAGVPLGTCLGSATCEPFTTPSTLLSSIPRPPRGLCEP
jgi:hypothetical protein